MIIKLTRAEVHRFVSAALNINPSSFTVEISDNMSILLALRNATVEFPLYNSSQKISCIKAFRGGCPKGADSYSVVGLADAKWAVENVSAALHNLETTGQLR